MTAVPRCLLRLAPTLLLALAPAVAGADAKSEAAAHIEKATALHAEHKLSEALAELTIAYTLDPQADLLYAIAQTHVQLGDCPQAITFYERFLSTRPAAVAAAAAREAIDTCRTQPPPALEPVTDPDRALDEPTAPSTAGDGTPTDGPRAGFRDPLGLSLLGGGAALGVLGVVTYSLARADLADAESSATYGGYADGVDRAHRKRLLAGGLGIAGAVLVGAGAVRLWQTHGRETKVAAAPTAGGGLLVLGGRW